MSPRLHHVNVVVPPGRTADAVAFYADLLGLRPMAKPGGAAATGAWLDVDGLTQVHISERAGDVHADAHFALVVDDYDAVLGALAATGATFTEQEDVFGGRRGFTRDPLGNRVEILEPTGELNRGTTT